MRFPLSVFPVSRLAFFLLGNGFLCFLSVFCVFSSIFFLL